MENGSALCTASLWWFGHTKDQRDAINMMHDALHAKNMRIAREMGCPTVAASGIAIEEVVGRRNGEG